MGIAFITIKQYFAPGEAGAVLSVVGVVIALRGIIGFWKPSIGQQNK
jgi:hypothetical protein